MKAVQYFTPEYLERCSKMSPTEILQFLEEFRLMFAAKAAPQQIMETAAQSAGQIEPEHYRED
jgi:hypothetical protein